MIEQFATIVGLLSAFSSGRGVQDASGLAEFQTWLAEHNHKDIVHILENSSKTNIFVKAYLNNEIPEIQRKLDLITDLVLTFVKGPVQDEAEFSGEHFLKGVMLLALERIIGSGLRQGDFDIALSYAEEMVGEHCDYNKYVFEKMIRECLRRQCTATAIQSTYWADLIESS